MTSHITSCIEYLLFNTNLQYSIAVLQLQLYFGKSILLGGL